MTRYRLSQWAPALAVSFAGALVLPSSEALCQQVPGIIVNPTTTQSEFELHTSAVHSDNVRRTRDDEVSGTIYTVGAGINVDRKGTRLDVAANGQLDWAHYPSNTFGNDVFGYFDGRAQFEAVQDRFFWLARETYGQQLVDPFATATPNNLIGVNYFTTGPRLNFRFSPTMSLAVLGDYSVATHDDHTLDTNRYGGGLALIRQPAAESSLSLNAYAAHVRLDSSARAPDYDMRQLFLGYEGQVSRTKLTTQLGYSEVDRNGGDKQSGLLARLQLQRRMTAASTLSVYGSRTLSDGADAFRTRLDDGGPTTALTVATNDTFVDTTYGAAWAFQRQRTTLNLGFSGSRERYNQQINSDRNVSRVDGLAERRIGPQTIGRLLLYYQRDESVRTSVHANEKGATATLEWLLGRYVSTTVHYGWYDRNSTDIVSGFTDRRVGVTLSYRPFGQGRR